MLIIDRGSFDYVPYYCEENVWRLLGRRELSGLPAWALLVSSPSKDFMLLRQRAGRPVDGLVHWDYHVLALVEDRAAGLLALDLDTELPFPCPAARYLEETFPAERQQSRATPSLRMIEAADYLAFLVSDRSHMRRPNGSWRAPPPPWPWPGQGSKRPNVLEAWIDMGRREPGRVLGIGELAELAAKSERAARRLRDAR
ncbi:MAG TPA: hypothetical protein PLB91_06450 [Spirochaetales bacterium]|nr:hypothetical protein [Spirochaetales bacterium]HRY56456.1 hypothetical protein [Spirochaetia bacterium]HRZ64173.1 hypothetical protein [Spirochaetia bacterium]